MAKIKGNHLSKAFAKGETFTGRPLRQNFSPAYLVDGETEAWLFFPMHTILRTYPNLWTKDPRTVTPRSGLKEAQLAG
jgi:hypothetical protein